ncbi:hypothetical protein QFC24_006901 [Naganishia onofrii]|uniref:Uncharacterized protein n=1 Tax=Naganishia onofrii TaxID=1851511 RepID=A0ACC2WVJ5_9TREE|nr:hypothetical protein QFC24_006901 [Naganishia onofrii]
MPAIAPPHAVCPECHGLAVDDSAATGTRQQQQQQQDQPDVPPEPRGSETSDVANEPERGSNERAEDRPETNGSMLPCASQPVPIDSLPPPPSQPQQYSDSGETDSSMPLLTNDRGTFSLSPGVSCVPGTPQSPIPTPTLSEKRCEGVHDDGCVLAAPPFSHRAETTMKHRQQQQADIRPHDRTERKELAHDDDDDVLPDEGQGVVSNPILEVGRRRIPSVGRGCLFPGSLFRGKQTSGRSSYDVEVRILDVSFPTSTISGYLSISHLTETHPRLTTFFSGEIIGSTYGFLTGPAFYSAQATESDDMRHWSRFEHFQKVKGELKRPGLTMRDEASTLLGHEMEQEKPFCFMRWKERFLVPDHKVRDISGASFAGFYYLQLDFDPPPPIGNASSGLFHSAIITISSTSTSKIPSSTDQPLQRKDASRAFSSKRYKSPFEPDITISARTPSARFS